MTKTYKLFSLAALVTLAVLPAALAGTAPPVAGDPGFEVYEAVATNGIRGPIGIAVGIIGVGAAGWFLLMKTNVGAAIGAMVGAMIIFKAIDIALSFSAIF